MKNHAFDRIILAAVSLLLMIIITLATGMLFVLLVQNLWSNVEQVQTMDDIQSAMLRAISGVFVVLIALELRETLRAYADEHRFRLETVLVVGGISVARHVIQLDFHHAGGSFLAGIGLLIAALVMGYYFLKRLPNVPVAKDSSEDAPRTDPASRSH